VQIQLENMKLQAEETKNLASQYEQQQQELQKALRDIQRIESKRENLEAQLQKALDSVKSVRKCDHTYWLKIA
jgi:chromosome segregation ATPase